MPTKVLLTLQQPRMSPHLEASGLRHYEDYLAYTHGEVVGRTATTETRRILIDHDQRQEAFYLKTYRYQDPPRPARLSGDKARREARNYHILLQRCGLSVPEVISHGSRRRRWRLLDAFILTRAVPNAVPLDLYARRRWPAGRLTANDPIRRNLLDQTADLVSRMHRAGFFHIDLQWRNLLVSEDGTDRPPIFVIDSARGGLRRWGPYRMHGRLRDLSSLHKLGRQWLTRGEQIRWLRSYLGVRTLRAPEHRSLVQTILYDRSIKDNGTPK